MKSLQIDRKLWIRTRLVLLVAFVLCQISPIRARGNRSTVAASSPAHCDTGMSRHSLLPPSLVKTAAHSASSKAGAEHGPDGMVWVPGGRFWMGTDHMEDARPVHEVEVKGFWMDRTDVTNQEFARFVKATGYVTIAERPLNQKEFPNLASDELAPGSVVFTPPAHAISLQDPIAWWRFVRGANWRHPDGPNSDLRGKDEYPVVHIAWSDAMAYAKWSGNRLPTEAEWEFAARGGLDRQNYVWGNQIKPDGKWKANTFQGHFPDHNTSEDGYAGIAPVASFEPNGYGLYDMSGNVWQWVSDWYRSDYYVQSGPNGVPVANPQGPRESFDPHEPGVRKRVQKGGSFLCTDQYCERYMPGARGKGDPETATNHLGFRCVHDL